MPRFAKKSLGQNFLADQNYVDRIIDALNFVNDDTIVEIGPGRGALTSRLLEKAGRVIAIELDRDLIPVLETRFADYKNFKLTREDALEVKFADLISSNATKVKLVANLPYYISTAILQRLVDQREAFSEMVLMFQREVVDRITALPGDSERGFLTVIVEAYLSVEKLFDVPPEAFHPAPKVWSSVVRVMPKTNSIEISKNFRNVVSIGFQQKRKTIFNNLKAKFANAEMALHDAGVNTKLRAEDLSLDQWQKLSDALY